MATPNYTFLTPSQMGFGNWPGSAQGKPNPANNKAQLSTDTPTFNAGLGGYVNLRTGQPWTGNLPDGTYAKNGKKSAPPLPGTASIDPNNVAERYQAVDVVKDPGVSSAANDLLEAFKKGAADSLKGFDDYVKQFKDQAATATSSSRAASAQAGMTGAAMGRSQADYENALRGDISQLSGVNTDAAARERAVVDQANALLPQYDAAGNAIADRQLAEVVKNLSRYKLGTGTPRSLGGDESRILAQGAADVMLPLKQAQINRRYDILSGLSLPVERDIAGRATNAVAFNAGAQGNIYSSAQSTAAAIQGLKDAVARQDWTTALQLMQVPQLAAQVQQQILAGDTSLLGAVSALRDSSHYRGLQDKLGVNLSQPMYFSPGDMSYPLPTRYNRPVGLERQGYGAGGAGTATATTRQGAPSQIDYAYYLQTGVWPQNDPHFSQEAYDGIVAKFQQANAPRTGGEPTFVADPTVEGSGYRNRYTGLPVDSGYSEIGNVDYSTGE